jgi:diadenosine tetraphosphate (Ap4A) HIT family hydrolase
MIVPKKHTDSLGTLKASDKVEYVDLLAKYEAKGYNVYARPPRSTSKSIAHQHTHLIQLDGKQRRFVLLLRKPYIRFISQK